MIWLGTSCQCDVNLTLDGVDLLEEGTTSKIWFTVECWRQNDGSQLPFQVPVSKHESNKTYKELV